MEKRQLQHSEIEFHTNYAILRVFENEHISLDKARTIFSTLKEYFKNREFIFISHRVANYTLDLDVLDNFKMNTVRGISIVSSDPEARQRAAHEQDHFDKSFVFFEDLNDAIDWAKSFFK